MLSCVASKTCRQRRRQKTVHVGIVEVAAISVTAAPMSLGCAKDFFRSDHGTNFRLRPFLSAIAGADHLTPTSRCGGAPKDESPFGPMDIGVALPRGCRRSVPRVDVAALILASQTTLRSPCVPSTCRSIRDRCDAHTPATWTPRASPLVQKPRHWDAGARACGLRPSCCDREVPTYFPR